MSELQQTQKKLEESGRQIVELRQQLQCSSHLAGELQEKLDQIKESAKVTCCESQEDSGGSRPSSPSPPPPQSFFTEHELAQARSRDERVPASDEIIPSLALETKVN